MTTPRDESLDAEGVPELEGHPPGIDIETDQEGLIPPRDHPIAAGGEPGYPTTEEEARTPEGVAERAEREEPDVGARELRVGGGVQGADALRASRHRSHEDAADPLDLSEPDEDESERRLGAQLVGANNLDESGTGELGELIALALAEDAETSESAEEAAMHIESND